MTLVERWLPHPLTRERGSGLICRWTATACCRWSWSDEPSTEPRSVVEQTSGSVILMLNFVVLCSHWAILFISCTQSDSRVHAPRFPKAKDEGWWLVLGEVDSKELLAVKRLGFIRGRTRTSLAFSSPDEPCRQIYSLYLVSDCYLGLDQQIEMCFNFTTSEAKEWCNHLLSFSHMIWVISIKYLYYLYSMMTVMSNQ